MEKYTAWRKSSRSGGANDNCVEVAFAPDGSVGVRDSKNRDGAVLDFTAAEWGAFVGGVKDNEFDAPSAP
ncbi:hypothetical protein GCM10010123_27940 [Pilimelia anulata]|uniref:DUF397 domain-containing protein n=1 Tax=Pilimelia anulata TaxID=53371 RepID=A0A8J3FA54_9ACTN|nr:hypothetical protein GCM10010123_27940 [Pilimelia anulata]